MGDEFELIRCKANVGFKALYTATIHRVIEYQSHVTLKSGEVVDLSIIYGADATWLEPIEHLFAHKGEPWSWQNHQFLTGKVDFDTRYYVLHRKDIPFAAMLLSEHRGVGVLNHVWTKFDDRGKGASSSLMKYLLDGFKARRGKMMVLQTGFDSVAYHMYRAFGFESLEPKSGYMHWYTEGETTFYNTFFAAKNVRTSPLDWQHWLMIQPLLQGDFGDVIRSLTLKQLGRRSTEGAMLNLLRDEEVRRKQQLAPRAYVLQGESEAALGFALWDWHPLWIGTCLIDLYCHPAHCQYGTSLLRHLHLPQADRYVAFVDEGQHDKKRVLEGAGFRQAAVLKSWAAQDFSQTSLVDVTVLQR